MTTEPHIAVVDDDPDIRDTLNEYLSDHGYRISEFAGGEALRGAVARGETFDLVLLDITMPGEDGLSLARFMSQSTTARIMMVTASGETIDRIIGLEVGADDYLPKPVDLRELLARVKALLRRRHTEAAGPSVAPTDALPKPVPNATIAIGECRLDLEAQTLFDADGQEIKLSSMEFDMLRVFAERPNRVLSRQMLLELAHHGDWEPFDRSIDIRISRLRRKLERDPSKPAVLKTVRGAGYMLVGDR
ncbi:MAG: response regulator [Pseudomonadota bacterium]